MKKALLCLLVTCIVSLASAQQTLQSPAAFLGYELGDRFTPHHRIVEYFKSVDQSLDNVKVLQYGETNEHRPLIYAIIASPENFARLDDIRKDNLRRAGMLAGTPSDRKVAIVWMSYGVHGNESSSSEAAMKTLHAIADPAQKESVEWLKNIVVILDPCINPDGRDRYVNFYTQYGNQPLNPDPQTAEHREPWPGGRYNHYFFDLNRDWAWLTQKETEARVQLYNTWLPQVHVDFHEQSPSNPYYFAPAAEPVHKELTPWQKNFEGMIGRNNAKHFDEKGWLYFTHDRFDMFYPGYGDSYPMFNGAIGMTYEKGGGGSAGLKTITPYADTVSLKDRLTHHFTTGMSTLEISSANAEKLVDEFKKYFSNASSGLSAPYKAYVIRDNNNQDKINRLTAWLTKHGIQYGRVSATKPVRAYDFQSHATTLQSLHNGDLAISTEQPKGRLVSVLFDPKPEISDSLTYDVTAWNPVYAWSLKALAVLDKIAVTAYTPGPAISAAVNVGKPYAYVFRYQSLEDARLLASLLKQGIKVRTAAKAFVVEGKSFDAGSLIVTRRNNESVANFDQQVVQAAEALSRQVFTTSTGLVEQGQDFGATSVDYILSPSVALLYGEQTYPSSVGEVWYFFEQQIHFPIALVKADQVRGTALNAYSVLVVPEGSYSSFDDNTLESLAKWVGEGHRLVIIGEGLNAFADKKGFALKVFSNDQKKKEAEELEKSEKEKEALLPYNLEERRQLSTTISGAVYDVTMDATHPLSYGIGNRYYSLKTNALHFAFLESGANVGILQGKVAPVSGIAGYKANRNLSNSMQIGVETKGRGKVVYLNDDLLFRAFWETGNLLFFNAVFLSGL